MADSLRVLLKKKKEVLFTCVKRAFPSRLRNYMRVYLATGISIGSSLYTADEDKTRVEISRFQNLLRSIGLVENT